MADQKSLTELHDRLDGLWVAYLQALDSYAKAQQLLQTHTSKGFLSLARANFYARDRVTRYGKDFYHERAVAMKRVAICLDGSGENTKLKLVQWQEAPSAGHNDENDQEESYDKSPSKANETDVEPKQGPSPPATPEPQAMDNDKGKPENLASSTKSGDTPSIATEFRPSLAADPLRWFGILIPRELRSAHASFKAAVDGPVLDAVSAAKLMREIEASIRKLRKEIRRVEKIAS